MFTGQDRDWAFGGGPAIRTFGRAALAPTQAPGSTPTSNWTPDLAVAIGSRGWWRDVAVFVALGATAWLLRPDLGPMLGATPPPLAGVEQFAARAQAFAPLALGSTSGRRMPPNALAVPISAAPERATVDLVVTLGQGDSLGQALARAGVERADAATAAGLIAQAAGPAGVTPGARVALTLGQRPSPAMARPLTKLSVRVRFDLAIAIERGAAGLSLHRTPIAVDATPLRIRGVVGPGLYRSARAAGAPAKVVEAYIKALAERFSFGRDIGPADRFDMVVARERAATGETRFGGLLMAGLDQAAATTNLIRWRVGGQEGWFDADGRFEQRGAVGMPVAGRITSVFGMRFHPVLGFSRMHKGIDIGAPMGTPVIAVVAGTVVSAGWSNGGYGNFIRLAHAPGFATGYGHLSRIAVSAGQHVARGEVIGFVGSTGLSTGPHLHWEVLRNGAAVDPMTMSVDTVSTLTPERMAAFRQRAAYLLALRD